MSTLDSPQWVASVADVFVLLAYATQHFEGISVAETILVSRVLSRWKNAATVYSQNANDRHGAEDVQLCNTMRRYFCDSFGFISVGLYLALIPKELC